MPSSVRYCAPQWHLQVHVNSPSEARRSGKQAFRAGIGAAAALWLGAVLAATQSLPLVVTLGQDVRSRDEAVTIAVIGGPGNAASAAVSLSRNGQAFRLVAVYSPPAVNGAAGTVTATLAHPEGGDNKLPLGKYQVTAELDGRPYPVPVAKKLDLVPPGNPEPRLDAFAPAATDETQSLYLESKRPEAGARIGPVRAVPLVLHGAGFQTGEAAEENAIIINDSLQKLKWGTGCVEAAGTDSKGAGPEILAEAVSAREIRLCLLPVPASGEFLVKVAVGDHESTPQSFRVYRLNTFWAALASLVTASLLACIPLVLLHSLTRGYSIREQVDFKKRLLFLDPETDTYSLSKLQFYLWTVAALFSYTYLFISRVFVQNQAWPDVPGTLPGIIAVAAGTSVGAQVITSAKGSKGAGEQQPSLLDFITSGGVVAPDRVQLLLWTLYGVAAFVFASLVTPPGIIKDLPPVPEHLLYLMGLSSLGYLGGKMARKAGPVINEISVTPSDPDDVIAAGGTGAPVEMPDLRPAVLDARVMQAKLAVPATSSAAAAVDALKAAADLAAAAQTVVDLNALVASLVTLRVKADEAALNAADAYETEVDAAKKAALAADASVAQQAAAALQDLSANVTQSIAMAAASPMLAIAGRALIPRTITLRGTNLSPDGLLEIDHTELPFRMLLNPAGEHQPEVVAREESTPTLARVLRLSIEPSMLGGADLARFDQWFGSGGTRAFTLTNPDGQKAEMPLQLPPGFAQKQSGAKP